jgi:DNA polymerase-3 subunit gamma/tau
MNNQMNVNLARRWRSQNFDQIVGQELSIKMLKNSLYLGHYFPVYLFSGQRGCGKTTTARVFAAAVNCQELATFQKSPRSQTIPCLQCASCVALLEGKHPDFFEIDAASHTGVDTIRQIIDASHLLPQMGTKKIYLIDEAHMLSKASFNALLKILEEPPQSVLFILATTDDQKIIDTVKSRCFQLFFKPIATASLMDHLAHICQHEKINFEPDALNLIIGATQGSARDALNLLEQVRFANGKVTKEAVMQVIGQLDDQTVVTLFEHVLVKNPAELLTFLSRIQIQNYSAETIWYKLADIARRAVWIKHGVQSTEAAVYGVSLKRIVQGCSWQRLNAVLDLLYSNEQLFLKTTGKHALLELILLRMCPTTKKNNDENMSGTAPCVADSLALLPSDDALLSHEDEGTDAGEDNFALCWQSFLVKVDQLKDPILRSVFRQGSAMSLDGDSRLQVSFSKELAFFNDQIADAQKSWLPLLHESFGKQVVLQPTFSETAVKVVKKEPIATSQKIVIPMGNGPMVAQSHATTSPRSFSSQRTMAPREQTVDVSDGGAWPQAKMLMGYFPGVVTLVNNKEVRS